MSKSKHFSLVVAAKTHMFNDRDTHIDIVIYLLLDIVLLHCLAKGGTRAQFVANIPVTGEFRENFKNLYLSQYLKITFNPLQKLLSYLETGIQVSRH